jgi:hypothetical protein
MFAGFLFLVGILTLVIGTLYYEYISMIYFGFYFLTMAWYGLFDLSEDYTFFSTNMGLLTVWLGAALFMCSLKFLFGDIFYYPHIMVIISSIFLTY